MKRLIAKISYAVASLALVAAAVPVASYANGYRASVTKAVHSAQAVNNGLVAVSGTVGSMASSAYFTITDPLGVTYNVDTSTKAAQMLPSSRSLGDIQVGDELTVIGTPNGGMNHGYQTIVAQTVQDGSFLDQDGMIGSVRFGTVTAKNGSTITLSSVPFNGSAVTYMVDASSASLVKGGNTAISLSDVAVGDRLMVIGPISGSNITATSIRDLGAQGSLQASFTDLRVVKVSSVSGSTITATSSFGTQATYTINAAGASIASGATLNGTPSSISSIAVGDQLIVRGPMSGSSITASEIRDLGAGDVLGSRFGNNTIGNGLFLGGMFGY